MKLTIPRSVLGPGGESLPVLPFELEEPIQDQVVRGKPRAVAEKTLYCHLWLHAAKTRDPLSVRRVCEHYGLPPEYPNEEHYCGLDWETEIVCSLRNDPSVEFEFVD